MLSVVDESLKRLIDNTVSVNMSQNDRLKHFSSLGIKTFTRKDYMLVFKNLSSSSASRDLKAGLELGLFTKSGDKRLTTYNLNRK